MAPPYCYDYPRPSVTVDLVVFRLADDALRVLLVRRKQEPFAGYWAIPGGFLDLDEPADEGALRELREETGLSQVDLLAPIGFFAGVDRDPRGRVISLAHAGVVREPSLEIQGGDDAAEARWMDPRELETLAFDHKQILGHALQWLASQVQNGVVGLRLLPEVFGKADVKRLFQAIGGTPRGASAWRKRLKKSGMIAPVPGSWSSYQEGITPDLVSTSNS